MWRNSTSVRRSPARQTKIQTNSHYLSSPPGKRGKIRGEGKGLQGSQGKCACVSVCGNTLKHFRAILKRCQQNLCKWYVNATYMEISIRSQNAPKAAQGKARQGIVLPHTHTHWHARLLDREKRVLRGARPDAQGREAPTPFALLVKVLISCYMCQNFNDADKSCSQNGLLCVCEWVCVYK